MKRSISLILLAAACLLALAAVTALSGCVAKPAFSDPTGGVTTPASPTGQSAVYTSGNVDMALTIPEGWQWEAVQDKELSAEGIRFRKTDDKAVSFELLCWRNGYGICGTGVTSTELTLSGGQKVWQHTEERQGSVWVNIAFVGMPGDYVCMIDDDGTMDSAVWDGCRDEVLAILGTAQLGRGILTEQQAIDLAAAQYDGTYDMAWGRYDVKTGCWAVMFSKGAMGGGNAAVRYVDNDGAVSDEQRQLCWEGSMDNGEK